LKSITHPTVGNHEYGTSDASGYWDYFDGVGARTGIAGERGKGWYSYDVGTWHLVVLNTNCGAAGGCDAGSPQESWLKADLAAHRTLCTIVYAHHPRWTSDTRDFDNPSLSTFYQDMYDAGVELYLVGHSHFYERMAPAKPDETIDRSRGVREIIVGTGGRNVYGFGSIEPISEVRNDTTFGVLSLTLHPGSYDWRFVPVVGETFRDSGSDTCYSPAGSTPPATGSPDTTPPSAPAGLAASAPSATEVDLRWSASTDDVGVAGYKVFRDDNEVATVSGTATTYADRTVGATTSYRYYVKAVDAAGNVSPTSNVASVTTPAAPDTTPPTVTLTQPAAGATINDSTPTFEGSAGTDAGDSTTVTVKVYRGTSTSGTRLQTLAATRGADGSWSVTASPALAQGTYTVRARQSDAAGNVGSSDARSFTIDTTAPRVALTAPADGSLTDDATPTFAGTGGTTTGDSATVTVLVYGGAAASGTPVQALPTTRASNGTWSVTSPVLTDGAYTVQAEQADAAGNIGSSGPRTFRIDRTPPTAALSFSPTAPVLGQTVSFDASASNDLGGSIASYEWTFGDGAGAGEATPSHVYSATGTYTVQVTVTDLSGYTGAAAAPLTVQTPAVSPFTSPLAPIGPALAPPRPAAPRVSLNVPKQKLSALLRRGLVVFLTSDKAGRAGVRVVLDSPSAHRLGLAAARPVTVSRSSTRIAIPGRAVKIVLKPSARTRRALARTRRVSLTLKVHVTDAAGLATTLRQTVVVRR
jgi:chitodextrinase